MTVLIADIDSTIKNIAIEKIKMAYPDHQVVDYDFVNTMFYNPAHYESVWVSCIFDWNRHLAARWEDRHDNMHIGGSGYSLDVQLPEEIDSLQSKINMGFTTRGCIRKCQFCIVPQKEGALKRTGDIYDMWDLKSREIRLLDNNLSADREYFFYILNQIKKENLKVKFDGMDIRLMDEEMIMLLKEIKVEAYGFAFDNIKAAGALLPKLKLLIKHKIQAMFYVLVGFDSTIEEDVERVRILVENNQRAYIMRHRSCHNDKRYIALARWCNAPFYGKGTIPFNTYLNETPNGRKYKKYFE